MTTKLLESIAKLAERNSAIYAKLPTSRAIRVLVLQPGAPLSRISCDMMVLRDYAGATLYHAASYCWGDFADVVGILCDGKPFFVTGNLHGFLQRLRSVEEVCVLWVDAICINQFDDAERSRQVGIMHQIYSNAARVLVWLGPSDRNTPDWIEALHEIFDKCGGEHYSSATRAARLHNMGDDTVAFLEHTGNVVVDENFWKRLGPLFQRSWFRRTWVVQEVQGCEDTRVLCGEEGVDWREVALAARFAHARETMRGHSPPGATASLIFPHRRTWNVYHVPQAVFMAGPLHTDVKVPLLQILQATRCFASTDPRDKVFSMLQHPFRRTRSSVPPVCSHASAMVHLNMKPDYNKTVSAVYAEVALRSIVQPRSLEILSHYWAGVESLPGVPRWVPRWDIDYAPSHIPLSIQLYDACRSLPCSIPNGSRLIVQGIVLGAVVTKSDVLTYSKALHDVDNSFTPRIHVGSLRTAARIAIHDTCRREIGTSADAVNASAHDQLDETFADFAAFLLESMPCPPKSFYRSMCEKWCDTCETIIARHDMGTAEPTIAYQCEPLCNDLTDICTHCYDNGVRCSVSSQEPHLEASQAIHYLHDEDSLSELESAASRGSSERYFHRLRNSLMCRTWFSTSRGDVGSGTLALLAGDIVTVLHGARVPFLLREQPDGLYRLVGDCYVDGMMDGEAIKLCEDGTLCEQTFELR